MNRLLVKDLHLAAYMKSNGAKFLGHESKHFVFEDTKALGEWRVEHSNSCCRRVDLELISLRKLMKQGA